MTRLLSTVLMAALAAAPLSARSEDLASAPAPSMDPCQSLMDSYDAVRTLSCTIRKTTSAGGRRVTMISRVFFERPHRIHVENVAPAHRRIVSDGSTLYFHVTGQPLGYSSPVDKLPPDWKDMLGNVPGSPMEHLRRLKGRKGTPLPAPAGHPVRVRYDLEKLSVVLSCDASNRLARLDFYAGPDLKAQTAEYTFSQFKAVAPGCWIPCLHKALLHLPDGGRAEETRRIENVTINKPIAPNIFKPELFFTNVEFVADFDKLGEQ